MLSLAIREKRADFQMRKSALHALIREDANFRCLPYAYVRCEMQHGVLPALPSLPSAFFEIPPVFDTSPPKMFFAVFGSRWLLASGLTLSTAQGFPA